jgi:class 3 adenylate cyclase
VVGQLNQFFGLIIPIIEARGGHPNKLLGDGLMALFGIPVPVADHADRALDAALSIDKAIRGGYQDALRVGIGINTGVVVARSMGGGTKLDYTVIGDAVNVASRVEAMTRITEDTILLTATTRAALTIVPETLQPRGSTAVKGREQPIAIFGITAATTELPAGDGYQPQIAIQDSPRTEA